MKYFLEFCLMMYLFINKIFFAKIYETIFNFNECDKSLKEKEKVVAEDNVSFIFAT